MKITFPSAIHLLHEAAWGCLATHSAQMPGYPFATALPFALDEQHCPLLLISDLAEHTKNLMTDSRASLLIQSQDGQHVLTTERISIVGDVAPVKLSADGLGRYLRYHPDAKEYLALGDFSFYRLLPQRARYVAGFGNMGWIENEEWSKVEVLPLADERNFLQGITDTYSGPGPLRVLGIDCYGFDFEKNGQRTRQRFSAPAGAVEQIGEVVRRFLVAMA